MEVQTATPHDWDLINDFLDQNLRSQVDWSLRDEYPFALSKENINNIRVMKQGGEVMAHAVVHPILIKTHYHLFKVGLIGSVVTHENHRGQGMSRQILKSCLSHLQAQKCDLAMLWTDLFSFYTPFGFEVAGSEVSLEVGPSFKAPPLNPSLKIMETSQVSSQALLRLFNQHQLRSLRRPSHIDQYLKIPNTQVYTAWNRQTNQMTAYCVMGKGMDFTNYIHEWGGQVSSLMSLVGYIFQKNQKPVTLIAPLEATNLIKQMVDQGAKKYLGVLGMMALLNPESFCKKIKKGARLLGYEAFVFEFREGKYSFGYEEEIYSTDAPGDMIRLIFGPSQPHEIHPFSPKTLEIFGELFPIPFWVWGWDSI